jgi:hypothetical protein
MRADFELSGMIAGKYAVGTNAVDRAGEPADQSTPQGFNRWTGMEQQADQGVFQRGQRIGPADLLGLTAVGEVAPSDGLSHGPVHGRESEGQDVGMEILLDDDRGKARKAFQLRPALLALDVFLDAPALMVKGGEQAGRIPLLVEQGRDQHLGLTPAQPHADEANLQGLGGEPLITARAPLVSGGRKGHELAVDIARPKGTGRGKGRAGEPHTEVSSLGVMQGQQPEGGIATVVECHIIRLYRLQVIEGQFPLADAQGTDRRVQDELMTDRVEQGDSRQGGTFRGCTKSVFDRRADRQTERASVNRQDPPALPQDGSKPADERGHGLLIEGGEGLGIQVEPCFAECRPAGSIGKRLALKGIEEGLKLRVRAALAQIQQQDDQQGEGQLASTDEGRGGASVTLNKCRVFKGTAN